MATKKKSNVVKKTTNKKTLNENKNNENKNNEKKKTTTKKNSQGTKNKVIKKEKVKNDFHEKLQSFISILFTIIVFILLIFLIFVLYKNYIKPNIKIDKEEYCDEYIKKDYHINKESVLNFIINKRHILYNIERFNRSHVNNDDLLNIAKFIIWNTDSEYIKCDGEDKCLVTKKEMTYDDLITQIDNFLQIDGLSLSIPDDNNDKTRLYENADKVVLTFSEFEYETYKHDVVDIMVDENIVKVYYALAERITDTDYYNYIGNKIITLKYLLNGDFYLESVETNIK